MLCANAVTARPPGRTTRKMATVQGGETSRVRKWSADGNSAPRPRTRGAERVVLLGCEHLSMSPTSNSGGGDGTALNWRRHSGSSGGNQPAGSTGEGHGGQVACSGRAPQPGVKASFDDRCFDLPRRVSSSASHGVLVGVCVGQARAACCAYAITGSQAEAGTPASHQKIPCRGCT